MARFKLCGCTSRDYRTDVDAYIDSLRALQPHVPDQFFEQLRNRCATRARPFFAPKPRELFPRTPSLASDGSHYRRVAPNWYADINLSNKGKERILRVACDLAGLSFPGDFEIEFNPGHHTPLTAAEVSSMLAELED